MKNSKIYLLLLCLFAGSGGVADAATGGTVQVRNLTDNDAIISMDGAVMCTAKAHSDNEVRGTFCAFAASVGSHEIRAVYSNGKTDSGTVSFTENDSDNSGDVRVITLSK